MAKAMQIAADWRGRMGSDASQYGKRYFCVKTPLSQSGDVYLHADDMSIVDGTLCFFRDKPGQEVMRTNIAFAPGQWTVFFAASVIDGHAVAVEHWKGEIAED